MKNLKRFISYYKPHLPMFILDMLCAVVVALANLFYPTVAKNIINGVSAGSITLDAVILSGVLLFVVYIVKAICQYIVAYYGHVVGVRMQADMRRDLFHKFEKLSFSYYDDHKTGDLMSRLTNDLFEISELAHHGPENVFLATLMLIGSFIILSATSIKLTLIMFAIGPFIVIFTALSRKSMRDAMRNSRVQTAVINSTLENSLTGVRETKSYAMEHHEIEKFGVANDLLKRYKSDAMRSFGRYDSVMQFLSDLLYLAIILAGGIFFLNGEINEGEFASFLLFISMFLGPIQRFVSLFEQMQNGMTGFSRFTEILDLPEEEDTGRVELGDIRGEIVFNDVSFGYTRDGEDKLVISGLNLTVPAGKTVALVGPSGGGKSTLCNLIPRFYNISRGSITLDGVDVRDITLSSLRRSIGTVSQNVFLFDGTARDNIAYGKSDATDEEIVAAARRANIHDYIMTLDKGYDTELGERGVKLSGGQRQRIAIARAFLKNPKLLILDEATSALDNFTEMQIQSALEELSQGRTTVVVAHRLSTVKNADKIVVIDHSGIVESGTHDELIQLDGEYKKLYEYQFKNR